MKTFKPAIIVGLLAGALTIPGSLAMAKDHGKFHIPPGHLPPPGKCRIWYPGTPPGHQPAPGECWVLSRRVPQGALLVSRERVWMYDERPAYYYARPYPYSRPDGYHDYRYPGGAYDGRSYARKSEIREDLRELRAARKDAQEDRDQLQKNYSELKKDRAELRNDIRNGAGRKEIRQDRREIREDMEKIAASKRELRQSENRLEGARRELDNDLRRR